MKMQLSEIANAVGAKNDISQWESIEVTSVQFDSRKLTPGALFIPLLGENDGHDYLNNARKAGAVASLWAADHVNQPTDFPILVVDDTLAALQDLARYYLNKINPRVVAVTGSNGKTTTKDMVAAVLATQFNVTKTYANFNNNIGVPITILTMEPNTEILVVEMGMDRPGQLDFLSKLVTPDIAIITMIGEAHIEFFGTRDRIADAKLEITHGLSDDGIFVYDGDEPLLRDRAESVSERQATFGRQTDDDLYALEVEATDHQISFKTNRSDLTYTIPMMGEYNVNNALAALLVADIYQIRPENAKRGLANVSLTENRTEWIRGDQGEMILSDVYNSNPTAVKEVLSAFAQTPVQGRHIVVLGDMLELGDQADDMHAALAEYLDPQTISTVYLVGDHMKALQGTLTSRYSADNLRWYAADQLDQLTTDVAEQITADDQLLLKGSHGIHLEKVLAALEAKK
ncbi:UDP-N-acetylmuramoyl-tripeptide--D-alanyl-D-alanine ligase [Levilactobacillus bambusae]|uniref:UDP-N-acetylmuramoyl-tripeptide--D-alanyl-D-alanine ligase n=1 Tax=Levilactobacillus bambusae TaxID=2024736 RepID=A0A2V1MYZ1_9LACO|nr:UDP-N-acetylmuramoyl-tripeptide--D-alanyl-D-alanine ligase [Levilactobacillus bambusae]PWF99309.1 UDP-N-acetylmuramoyl-tripeptide--D-alanyl-D-alanine ligase [Levilactobacillus bambusae]